MWDIVVVVFVVDYDVVVVVDPRNLHLKFCKNQVSIVWNIIVVNVVVVVIVVVDPTNLTLKFGWNWVSNG